MVKNDWTKDSWDSFESCSRRFFEFRAQILKQRLVLHDSTHNEDPKRSNSFAKVQNLVEKWSKTTELRILRTRLNLVVVGFWSLGAQIFKQRLFLLDSTHREDPKRRNSFEKVRNLVEKWSKTTFYRWFEPFLESKSLVRRSLTIIFQV